jgi:hypothetical protein
VPSHGKPQLHLARSLVGEGDGKDFTRPRPALAQDVSDTARQHPGFAGACSGQYQNRTVQRFDGVALLGIET